MNAEVESVAPERLEALLDAFRRVHVLVVGDLMLDVYLRGGASRISPEAPVPVVRVQEEWVALGGAANVAANVVALGASCTIAGSIGDDVEGEKLRRALEEMGISGEGLIVTPDRPTTVKTRVLVRNQQVARYDRESDDEATADAEAALIRAIEQLAARSNAVAIEDYNKGVLTGGVIRAALAGARHHDRPVIVDPKARSFFDYGGATVFKPNLGELSAALRERVRYDDAAWLHATRARLGCENLLLTLGEHGMALSTATNEFIRVPAVARSVYDVSGAGDTVTAIVTLALAAGATLVEAALLATEAAGIEVGKAGVATVSPDELREAIQERRAHRRDHF
jgi:D-beta-D-heptose 7-phosphate kinase/D-beta-D-heptose 1-phosphate adenosyltransferase